MPTVLSYIRYCPPIFGAEGRLNFKNNFSLKPAHGGVDKVNTYKA